MFLSITDIMLSYRSVQMSILSTTAITVSLPFHHPCCHRTGTTYGRGEAQAWQSLGTLRQQHTAHTTHLWFEGLGTIFFNVKYKCRCHIAWRLKVKTRIPNLPLVISVCDRSFQSMKLSKRAPMQIEKYTNGFLKYNVNCTRINKVGAIEFSAG